MTETKKGTYLCADALACLGVIMLLGLQYAQKAGFFELPAAYENTPYAAGRWICLSGAMLLSACMGYALSSKRLSWRSFRPLLRLTYIYVISALGAMLMQRMLFAQELTLENVMEILYQFRATNTAKFVGMYFFLIIIAPFLNAAFRDLKTCRARLAFLAVTALISTVQPMLLIAGHYILPEWCKMLAPAAGFVGGAFVKQYAKRHHRFFWMIILLLVFAAEMAAVMVVCVQCNVFYYPHFDSTANLVSLAVALLLLSLFHSKKREESGVNTFFAGASGGALAALMLGEPMIDFLLPSISEAFPDTKSLLIVGLLAVPVIFALCCVVGLFLQLPVFLFRSFVHNDDDEEESFIQESQTEQQEADFNLTKPLRKLEPLDMPAPKAVKAEEPIFEPVSVPEDLQFHSIPLENVSVPEPESVAVPESEYIPKHVLLPVSDTETEAETPIPSEQAQPSYFQYDTQEVDDLIAQLTK